MQETAVIAGTPQDPTSQLSELRAHANQIKLHISDLEVLRGQINAQSQRLGADVDRSAIDKQLANVEHELASARIQLDATNQQIHDVESARDMARMTTFTEQPPPFLDPNFQRQKLFGVGSVILLLPLVLAFSRRIWRRGAQTVVDLENSPRLQRMEQAIESIAVEVERIGEAQRFTTKLLADRQPDAVARMAVLPRKEPGTITPH